MFIAFLALYLVASTMSVLQSPHVRFEELYDMSRWQNIVSAGGWRQQHQEGMGACLCACSCPEPLDLGRHPQFPPSSLLDCFNTLRVLRPALPQSTRPTPPDVSPRPAVRCVDPCGAGGGGGAHGPTRHIRRGHRGA